MSISSPAFVQLILRVQDPPPGVTFAVQRGRSELLTPFAVESGSPCFAFTLKLGRPLAGGGANFLGEFAQGTPTDRFVYLNSGIRAGQASSCWDRRAKLKLANIPDPLLAAAAGQPDRAILATVSGTASDGGPICATVPADAVTWALSERPT
ncbi:MAG: DUF5990 family protein [Burkholderiaceae bacterium]